MAKTERKLDTRLISVSVEYVLSALSVCVASNAIVIRMIPGLW